jgi:hypothetical protein
VKLRGRIGGGFPQNPSKNLTKGLTGIGRPSIMVMETIIIRSDKSEARTSRKRCSLVAR